MNTNIKICAIALMAAACGQAYAQDLSKEITLDRTVVPDQRAATRPAITPATIDLGQQNVRLQAAEYMLPGTVSNDFATLHAAAWADSVAPTPYRGYASLGYFPAMNLGANAGYRFLDTQRATAGAWLQYDGTQYTTDGAKMRDHTATIDAYGAYRPNAASTLSAAIDYTVSSLLHPAADRAESTDSYTKHANNFGIKAAWASSLGKLEYDAYAGFRNFAYNSTPPKLYEILEAHIDRLSDREGLFTFGASAGLTRGGAKGRWLGLDIDGQVLNTRLTSHSQALYDFKPYVVLGSDDFTARLGVYVGVYRFQQENTVNVAPDVTISYAPERTPFAVAVSATGGRRLNTAAQIFAIDPYMEPFFTYPASFMPIDIEAEVNIGSFGGFTMGFFGGFASVNDWLAPASIRYLSTYVFDLVDAKAWHLGARLGYAYKSYAELGLQAELGGSNHDALSWCQWIDGAKMVAAAYAKVRPISKLTVELGFDLRTKRHAMTMTMTEQDAEQIDLGSVANLRLGASYDITPQFTAFARAENLLGHKACYVSGLPMQGIHGLVGITAKF